MNKRLDALRATMYEQGLEALLIVSEANCRYISGFHGTGHLLITSDEALLFTSFLYRIQAELDAPAFTLCEFNAETPLTRALAEAIAERGLKQLAFESQHITVDLFTILTERLKEQYTEGKLATIPVLRPVKGVVESLREIKDSEEMVTLRQAIGITDAAIEAVLPHLRPDHTEREAAWMLEVAMRERGADAVAFPLIVATGPNGALPHAHPGDLPLSTGCPIVIDMGARYHGYHADLTRTVVLGQPDARFWEIYNIVLAAQQAALNGMQAGMKGADVDALARDYIKNAGYVDEFGHSLGHGVGLNIHEGPSLRSTTEDVLRVGSVFSVEPGIYLSDWGGVRIEDLVLLNENGCEVLSQAPKQPVIRNGR